MRTQVARVRLAGVLLLMLTCAALAATRPAVVVKREPLEVSRRTFDPNRPPADMPALSGEEAALTVSGSSCRVATAYQVAPPTRGADGQYVAKATIDQVTVTLGATATVWLPVGAAKQLKEHEEGHLQIARRLYDERAEPAARAAAQAVVGRPFTGRGDTAQAAMDAVGQQAAEQVIRSFRQRFNEPSQKIEELFDELTDHGRRKRPTSREAVEQALKAHPLK